jgi:Rrf2 family protein
VLQISRRVEYALRAVLRLANADSGQRLSFKEIAEYEDIPQDYLAKILRSLVDNGVVTSKRGMNGGYTLAMPPESITFLQVMEAADSAISINLCTTNGDGCARTTNCAMVKVWQQAEDAMRGVLAGTTLADVLGPDRLRLDDLTQRAFEEQTLPCQEL